MMHLEEEEVLVVMMVGLDQPLVLVLDMVTQGLVVLVMLMVQEEEQEQEEVLVVVLVMTAVTMVVLSNKAAT
jgi:hypothetical protein